MRFLLPIPGGPDNSAAFQGPLGFENDFPVAFGLLKLRSQVESPIFVKQKEC